MPRPAQGDWGAEIRSFLERDPSLPCLGDTVLARLELYLKEVTRWGEKVDLVAPRSLEELLDLSLSDALILARAGVTPGHIIDVGSGGGAPGVPLAILLDSEAGGFRFTFVEPRDKRVAFLRSIVAQLGFGSAEVLRARSDALPNDCADVSLARATLPPAEWVREGLRLAPVTWLFLAREAPPVGLDAALDHDETYSWPSTGKERRLVRYRRLSV